MLTDTRKARLEPILAELRKIEGIGEVVTDDWDSAGINLFLDIKVARRHLVNNKPMEFSVHLRTLKAKVRKICKEVGFGFLDWPTMSYSYTPAMLGYPREKHKEGYETSSIKIEVYI